jgi:hypothetical protein
MIRFGLDAGLLFWAAARYCNCSLRRFWRNGFPRILAIGGVLGLALLGMRLFLGSPWIRLGLGVLAVGLCLFASWVFVVDTREKPRIRGVLKTLLGQPAS